MDNLSESERDLVEHYLKTSSDVEICKAADQGDPSADYIFHTLWTKEKRDAVAAQVDKEWEKQWE